MENKRKKTEFLAVNAVLAAVICVVSFLPIRTLGLEITLSMVPVAVGACLFGPASAAILGGVFGIVSFIQCFGYSAFGAALLNINPIFTFIVCVPTRILAGFLAGLTVKAIKKSGKNTLSFLVGSIVAPVFNTVFFMGTLCLCFYNTEYIQGFVDMLGAANPIMFILAFVGINGLVEIIAGSIIAFPVTKAVSKAVK